MCIRDSLKRGHEIDRSSFESLKRGKLTPISRDSPKEEYIDTLSDIVYDTAPQPVLEGTYRDLFLETSGGDHTLNDFAFKF